MAIIVDLQIACTDENLPDEQTFQHWVNTALQSENKAYELTIRLVDREESQQLNYQYRNKNSPTNVLSFPFEAPVGIELDLLGDLVICAEVVKQQATEQNKPLSAHWAHMVIHGCLHLLGFDHINEQEAETMEQLEIELLASIGIADPYIEKL